MERSGNFLLPELHIPSQDLEGRWEGDPVRDGEEILQGMRILQDRGVFGGGVCGRQSQQELEALGFASVLGADVIATFFD